MPDLKVLAYDFADTLQRLLNATVCNGVTITSYVHSYTSGNVLVGHGLTKTSFEAQPFRLCLSQEKPAGWMDLSYKLSLDAERQYLMVVSSFVGVYANDVEQSLLFHVDYERNKKDGYPEAHLQIAGESGALKAWGKRSEGRALEDLHFPVGGRRYRPALEDVIEFLIAERLVARRSGWDLAVKAGRKDFQKRQLRAAIRRDMVTATQAVKDFSA